MIGRGKQADIVSWPLVRPDQTHDGGLGSYEIIVMLCQGFGSRIRSTYYVSRVDNRDPGESRLYTYDTRLYDSTGKHCM
jgi:hypothetical protein